MSDDNKIVLDADLRPLLRDWFRAMVGAAGDDVEGYFAETEPEEITAWVDQMTRLALALGDSFADAIHEELTPHEAGVLRFFLHLPGHK